MTSFDDILSIYRIERLELTTWIEQRWVRPRHAESGLEFDDADAARVQLIRDLRHDMSVDNEVMGMVLSILDQLYAARRMLKDFEEAVESLPEPLRSEVRERLRGDT